MDEHYVQAKFISPSSTIILPDYQFSLPTTSSSPDDLNELVNKLITDADSEWKSCSFDFIVDGILLRVSLNEFMSEHSLSNEDVLTIECILKEEAPVPHCTFTHDDWVADLTLTSKFLISASYDSTVHVWSLKNKKRLSKITGHSGAVKCIALLPKTEDSTLNFVTGSQDQSIMMWSFDEKTNKTMCKVVGRGHMRSVECLCSNEDGSRLASGSFDSHIKIWNTDPESSNEDCENVENANKKLKVNNEEQTAVTKTPMVTLAGHREVITGICWTDDSEITTCSWDRTICLWDLELAGQKSNFSSSVAFTSLAYSPKNRLLITGSTDPYVRLWDPRNHSVTAAKSIYSSHTGWVVDVDWSKTNENLFVSASYDKLLKMWDLRSLKAPVYDLHGHEDRLLCCDWTNPDLVASGGADNSIKLFRCSKL